MNRKHRFGPRIAGAFAVALPLMLAAGDTGNGQTPSYGSSASVPGGYLDQGWSLDTTENWYHVSQGTVFLPYPWFIALESETGSSLADPDYLMRFGFLHDVPSVHNPRGLPVGFSTRTPDAADKKAIHNGPWVGFACSTCHTGQISYLGQRVRIDGGPAHVDLLAFRNALRGAFGATAKGARPDAAPEDAARFARFAQRVIASGGGSPDTLARGLQLYIAEQTNEAKLQEAAHYVVMPPPGPGRLDAIHRGGNDILGYSLNEPANVVSETAPVRYPAIWDTPYMDRVLYDASIQKPLQRNIVEALGVGSPFDKNTLLSPDIVHEIQLSNIVAIHRNVRDLRSPQWPSDVLGAVDQAKAVRGAELYQTNCVSCHDLVNRTTHSLTTMNCGKAGKEVDRIKVCLPPLDTVKTDRRQAEQLSKRMVSLATIGGPAAQEPYTKAVQDVTNAIVKQWSERSPANKAMAEEVNGGRSENTGLDGDIRAPLAYRARPLNGVWAIAPYLHNGSVPTLHDLLLSSAERPKKFCILNWEFDPAKVGYRYDDRANSCPPGQPQSFIDTAIDGNTNVGHEYGTRLTDTERAELIEYLKTL